MNDINLFRLVFWACALAFCFCLLVYLLVESIYKKYQRSKWIKNQFNKLSTNKKREILIEKVELALSDVSNTKDRASLVFYFRLRKLDTLIKQLNDLENE